MQIQKDKSLRDYNTFGIEAFATSFVSVRSVEELQAIIRRQPPPYFILGGGSNLLLTQDLDALVIHNNIFGKKIIRDFQHCVYVEAGAGEHWHEFVLWTLEKNLGGIENLSLIPGKVGASPIQNIGAYGVELKDVFHRLEAVELATGKVRIFRKKDCQFGYRASVFKQQLRGKFCITKVILKLSKSPRLNLSYGAIQQTLREANVKNPTIKDVSDAVIKIRTSKLPDPAELGNAGSFFKNPEISKAHFERLRKAFPRIVFYPLENGKIKVPAGWLIEQCGWKGKRVGHTGSHTQQALVLVNYGNATGQAIKNLAQQITESVQQKFQIKLSAEVNVI
ncbi:MAG: UDP-N-acetylmuramate dehydrogenase [Bacteroidota bacterium]